MNGSKHGVLRTTGFRPPPLMTAARTLARQLAQPQNSATRVRAMEGDRVTDNYATSLAGQSGTGLVQGPGTEESGS